MSAEKDDAVGAEAYSFTALFCIFLLLLLLSALRLTQHLTQQPHYRPLVLLYVLFIGFTALRSVFFADVWGNYSYYVYFFLEFAPNNLQFAAEVVLCFIWCESHRHQVSCEISDKLTGIHMRWALWVRYGLLALCSTLCFFVLAGAEVESSPTTLYISMLGFDAAQCGVTIGLVLRAGNRLKYAVRQAFPQSPTRRIVCVQLALLSITFVNALLDIALIFAHYDGMATLQSDQQIW